ncbi:MAG: sigma 54-interacting transcriptional regulator [Bacteroidales bacterium]|jgi:transcriptional regulator with PAS, ATPase and Fis domain|nr:sigma 54-interacting transcriptional regulator [Bacteroidales bacterium]MDD2569628.1 sigma 54-interacting transcriptional regulator [Bacteroidales bacterium]MDD2812578.1 sigma 54-interacting transcriptional regulator [Bacteroidales bacterium]MDD3384609.1 sigma 54-interacting transcriptional regulator [Bacteroidales bacterium]MDD3812989.1 sigma 54-interacting transcriptional regulator [Bacteroidales bacterium]
MDIQKIKQRFEIIGNSPYLHRAIEVAVQVAPTDLSVLITGESGTGKEHFPQIIHQYSSRKHGPFIAVNCGAIPEGTIDSELFGHEKGAFTGAHEARKGYFEEANGGTIFLDEIGELPLSTQVRLLRVLETGEFIRVGSSKAQKTNTRLVAATNVNIDKAVAEGRFREDLYYRLNTVPIYVVPLRNRKEDIHLLFRKFALDFAEKYLMPVIRLDEEAQALLENYPWPGNIRQLKNISEQMSIIEQNRLVTAARLQQYLPDGNRTSLPVLYPKGNEEPSFRNEREILYQILFDMKRDVNDLKKLVNELMSQGDLHPVIEKEEPSLYSRLFEERQSRPEPSMSPSPQTHVKHIDDAQIEDTEEIIEESLSIQDKEVELIRKALQKHLGKRKLAAQELGISERTLYRKIKEFGITE